MSISLSLFLYIYLFGVGAFLLLSAFNLYHIFKYGLNQNFPYIATVLYVIITVSILFYTGIAIQQYDWQQDIDLFSISPSTPTLPGNFNY
jgi:hypothetical protein